MVVAEGIAGLNLNYNIVVLDPVELEFDNWVLDQETDPLTQAHLGPLWVQDPLVFAEGLAGLNLNHNLGVLDPVGECMRAAEACNIQCDGGHAQVAPPTEHTIFMTH